MQFILGKRIRQKQLGSKERFLSVTSIGDEQAAFSLLLWEIPQMACAELGEC